MQPVGSSTSLDASLIVAVFDARSATDWYRRRDPRVLEMQGLASGKRGR
jgi:hypothetical protein